MRNASLTGAVILICSIWLLVMGCGKEAEKYESDAASGEILAVVNGENITRDMFERRYHWLSKDARKTVQQNPSQFLQKMVDEELLYQQAMKLNYGERQDLKRKLYVAEKLTKQDVFASTVIEKEIYDKVVLTEDEIRNDWEANRERFNIPSKLTLHHILLPREAQAKEVKKSLLAGADFSETAGKFSIDDATREKGGLVGEQVKGSGYLNRAVEEAAFTLDEGEIGGPIKTAWGFHVIKVTDLIPGRERDFEQAKEDVRKALFEIRKEEDFLNYLENLRADSVIDVNEHLLTP